MWPEEHRAGGPSPAVLYDPAFLEPGAAEDMRAVLGRTLPWRQEQVTVWNALRTQPRLTSWHGDPGAAYVYSGLRLDPAPWTPDLLGLRRRLETLLGQPFNSVLANLYRSGADSIGWHSDDESCFGADPVIASISLGATRRFLLRHRATGETSTWRLAGGSLLVMAGTTQRFWKHSVPKTATVAGERINLTFRWFRS